jgi:hypothetical protein
VDTLQDVHGLEGAFIDQIDLRGKNLCAMTMVGAWWSMVIHPRMEILIAT